MLVSQPNFHSPKAPSCLGGSGAQGPNVRGHLALRGGTYREALGRPPRSALEAKKGTDQSTLRRKYLPPFSRVDTNGPRKRASRALQLSGWGWRDKGSNKIQGTKWKQLESDFKLRQAGKQARPVPPQGTPKAPSTTRQ